MEIKNKRGKIILRTDKANLREANLRGADLREANLRGADLREADLSEANTKYCIIYFSPSEYEQAKQFIEGLK